ncbi:endoplasmic reticulum metallopeptidase 1-like [Culicoides brevitarsis]|uniref:endoplasmic reticulum metallopeptidase 1-like n=1 Tax=Culicoides brevitarsis TaxID=469753 RepID=UPI00307BCB67
MEYELDELDGKRKRSKFSYAPNRRFVTSFETKLPVWVALCLIVALFGLFFTAFGLFRWLPTGLLLQNEERYPDRFIGEQAAMYVKSLTDIGDRVAGTPNNEDYTVQLLLDTVEAIKKQSHESNLIEVDHQVQDGSYYRDKVHYPQLNVYRGIQNVVVKLSKANASAAMDDHYILLNAHFDTVPMSPGAGDDATMVGVMLEVLRTLSKREHSISHPIVFLFNGCEETELQGSHAFISGHPWFRNVRALINLDAGGIGGKEMLFRATPEHSWIMRSYSKGALNAYASTVGEEMFEANLIPSDTDFRNFKNYAKDVAAIDCAQNYNGYVYHTKYDDFSLIDYGSLQHTGDNVIAVMEELDDTKEIKRKEVGEYVQEGGSFIFYDIMGLAFVFYSKTDGIIINSVVIVACTVVIGLCLVAIKKKEEMSYLRVTLEMITAIFIQIMSIFCAACFMILLAIVYDLAGRPLSFFSNTWLLFFNYYVPFLVAFSLGPHLYIKYREMHQEPVNFFVQMNLHAHCFILCVILLIGTALGVKSSFIVMMNALGYLITTVINLGVRFFSNGHKWVYLHCFGQILPITFYFYMAVTGYTVLIPTLARSYSGGTSNPDIFIALLTIVIGYLTAGFIMPLFNLFKHRKYIYYVMIALWGIGLIMMVTPLGFPFKEATAVQRFTIWHSDRTFTRFDGVVDYRDSGFYVHSYDRLGSKTVKSIVPQMQNATKLSHECEKRLFCGVPFYLGLYHGNREHSVWIPSGPPKFEKRPELTLVSKTNVHPVTNSTVTKLYRFRISGPSRMSIHLSPVKKAKIQKISLLKEELPPAKIKWHGRDMYFINFTVGKRDLQWKSIEFTVEVEAKDVNRPFLLDMGFVAQFINEYETHTKEFQDLVSNFPKWTNVQHWTSIYEGYQF